MIDDYREAAMTNEWFAYGVMFFLTGVIAAQFVPRWVSTIWVGGACLMLLIGMSR